MGRPKKDEAEKKLQLNIRVKPTTKAEIEAHADRDGCTVSAKAEQLIEAMLDLSDDADQETIELLSDIVSEIQTVQNLTNGKWHSDLATWAAVSEIFKGSPIKKKKPRDGMDDPAVQKAWNAYLEIIREIQSLIMMMQKFGIEINEKPSEPVNPMIRGIFGKTINYRKAERQNISEMVDADERNKAETIFSMIEDADKQAEAALKIWNEESEPYREQELLGYKLYKAYRRKHAFDLLRKGGIPDIGDL